MIPFGLEALMTVSLPIGRRATTCFVPGASALWVFNDGPGTTIFDRSGNGVNATLAADAAAPTWREYGGLTHDGGDNSSYTGISFANTQPFTIVAAFTCSDASGTRRLVYNIRPFSPYPGFALSLNRTTAGKLDVHTGSAATNFGADLNDGNPHIATMVCYGDGTVGVAIDGGVMDVRTSVQNTALPAATTGYIGAKDAASTEGTTGDLHLLGVYPFAFSAAQIAQSDAAVRTLLTTRAAGTPWTPPTVLFSFDDGCGDVYTDAYPALAALDLPATAYIVSEYIGDADRLTLAQIQEMYAAGWDIGNHTDWHSHLDEKTEAEQETRIETCAAYLEANGMPRGARHLAYPFGGYNADTFTAMAATGILTGRVAVEGTMVAPAITPYEIGGIHAILTTTTLDEAKAFVTGAVPGEVVVVAMHRINTGATAMSWPTADFAALAAYVKAKGCRVVTISDLYDYIQAGYVWP